MYDFNTPLWFGKYKCVRIIDIPDEYLLNLAKSCQHKELKTFIAENLEKIKIAKESPMPRFTGFRCNKVTFPSKESAKRKIAEIRNINELRVKRYGATRKAPVRAYECNHCGGWHLTSKLNGDISDERSVATDAE